MRFSWLEPRIRPTGWWPSKRIRRSPPAIGRTTWCACTIRGSCPLPPHPRYRRASVPAAITQAPAERKPLPRDRSDIRHTNGAASMAAGLWVSSLEKATVPFDKESRRLLVSWTISESLGKRSVMTSDRRMRWPRVCRVVDQGCTPRSTTEEGSDHGGARRYGPQGWERPR